jgi:hypothetical protein
LHTYLTPAFGLYPSRSVRFLPRSLSPTAFDTLSNRRTCMRGSATGQRTDTQTHHAMTRTILIVVQLIVHSIPPAFATSYTCIFVFPVSLQYSRCSQHAGRTLNRIGHPRSTNATATILHKSPVARANSNIWTPYNASRPSRRPWKSRYHNVPRIE